MVKYYVNVQFGSSGIKYVYLTVLSTLTRGDHVLVDSSNGLGIAKVTGYISATPKATSWVLAKIEVDYLRGKLISASKNS